MLPKILFEPGFKYSTFAEATAITATDGTEGTYSAVLPRDWCIGIGSLSLYIPMPGSDARAFTFSNKNYIVPHGGYLASLLLHTGMTYMTAHPLLSLRSQPHPLHISITFLSRCVPGAAQLITSTLKAGRQFTFVRVTLRQRDVVCLEGTMIFTHFTQLQKGISLRTLPAVTLPPRDGPWATISADPLHEFRPVAKKLLYGIPPGTRLGSKKSSPSVREQWVKMADGSRFGLTSLGYLSDMFLPLPENYEETTVESRWYPTLALSLEIKRAPPEGGWEELFCRIESKVIERGRMDITVEIFDVEGNVVGISHHTTIILDAARNTGAERAKL